MFLISCSEVIEEAAANAVGFLGNKVRELAEEQRLLINVIRDEVV